MLLIMRTSTALLFSTLTALVMNGGISGGLAAADAAVIAKACRVTIEMSTSVLRWNDDDVRRFRGEADRIWRRHGVELCWREASHSCGPAPTDVYFTIAYEVPSAAATPSASLGWIGFSERSGPGPFVVLSVRRAELILGRAEAGGRRFGDLPGMVERRLPRALGRAFAHELGHFLLNRRSHSRTGVMRDVFGPDDLANESGARLQLASADRLLLGQRCGTDAIREARLGR